MTVKASRPDSIKLDPVIKTVCSNCGWNLTIDEVTDIRHTNEDGQAEMGTHRLVVKCAHCGNDTQITKKETHLYDHLMINLPITK